MHGDHWTGTVAYALDFLPVKGLLVVRQKYEVLSAGYRCSRNELSRAETTFVKKLLQVFFDKLS
jgi:hypothetical protein